MANLLVLPKKKEIIFQFFLMKDLLIHLDHSTQTKQELILIGHTFAMQDLIILDG